MRCEKLKIKSLKVAEIEAEGIHYRILNKKIHQAVEEGYRKIILENVCGQRYIGDGLRGSDVQIIIKGVPGNDLAAFMDGPEIIVRGNAQDGVGNTMNAGEVVIYGGAGDILGYSMRGGRILVRGDVGYRVGIHMKAYRNFFPVIVVGGVAGDFLGEYMAGGLLIILGLRHHGIRVATGSQDIVGDFVGTGMHGGEIFIRGRVDLRKLGKEVKIAQPSDEDMDILKPHLEDFCRYFQFDLKEVLKEAFIKLYPHTHRPYGRIYAY